MTIFTYITGITLGSMIGEMVIHGGMEFMEEVVSVILWGVFSFVVEYIGLKIPSMRFVLNNEPSIVIKRDEIQIEELRKMRPTTDDLMMLLREKDVFTVQECLVCNLRTSRRAECHEKSRQTVHVYGEHRFTAEKPILSAKLADYKW
jgi:uncharacterized membrane protein YcaP (DUF421 family)